MLVPETVVEVNLPGIGHPIYISKHHILLCIHALYQLEHTQSIKGDKSIREQLVAEIETVLIGAGPKREET